MLMNNKPRGLFGSASWTPGIKPQADERSPLPGLMQQPAPKQVEQPKPRGTGRRIAGYLADFLAGMNGQSGPYASILQQEREVAERQRMFEQQRRAGFDDFVQRKTWERDNMPQGADPTSLQQNYDWLMRMGNKAAAENLLKRNTDPIQWIPGPDGIPRPFSMGSAEPQVLGETLPEGWAVDGGPSLPATGGFRR